MFKTIRRYYWVTKTFLSRHHKIIFRTTAIVLASITLFVVFVRYIPTPKKTIRIGRIGKYTLESVPSDIQAAMSQGLVNSTKDGTIKPGLAQSWEVRDDGKTYVFTIDSSLKWHDGSTVTPGDILYNFKDVETVIDGNTIAYHLKEPFAPFFTAVSRPILKKNRLGIGEFRLTKTKVNNGVLQSLTLESQNEQRIYKFYPTEVSAITAYKLGEINRIEDLSSIPDSIARDTTNVIEDDESATYRAGVLFFNNNDALLTKPVRQALAYAIKDKSFGKERVLSPIDKLSWSYNNLVKSYDYDPERAKTLLEQAIKDPSSEKLEIKTMLQYLDVAESIAASWREVLGIQVDVKVVSSMTSDYQVILADFIPPLDPDQYAIWHSTQATNFTHFNNLKIDQLLEVGRRTSDSKLRKDIYQDFQRFLLEDCPAVFLFKSNTFTLSRKPLVTI